MKGLNLFFRSKHFLLIQSLVSAQMQIIKLQECLLLDAVFSRYLPLFLNPLLK